MSGFPSAWQAGIDASREADREMRKNCIKGQCRSPIACGSFGYCRELNMVDTTLLSSHHRAQGE